MVVDLKSIHILSHAQIAVFDVLSRSARSFGRVKALRFVQVLSVLAVLLCYPGRWSAVSQRPAVRLAFWPLRPRSLSQQRTIVLPPFRWRRSRPTVRSIESDPCQNRLPSSLFVTFHSIVPFSWSKFCIRPLEAKLSVAFYGCQPLCGRRFQDYCCYRWHESASL